jgi:hypothetical protein
MSPATYSRLKEDVLAIASNDHVEDIQWAAVVLPISDKAFTQQVEITYGFISFGGELRKNF